MPSEIQNLLKHCDIVYFMSESTIFNHWGVAAPKRCFHKPSDNQSINHKAVCRAVPGFAQVCLILSSLHNCQNCHIGHNFHNCHIGHNCHNYHKCQKVLQRSSVWHNCHTCHILTTDTTVTTVTIVTSVRTITTALSVAPGFAVWIFSLLHNFHNCNTCNKCHNCHKFHKTHCFIYPF